LINVPFAAVLFERGVAWTLAGFPGAVVGSMWDFSLSSFLTLHKATVMR